MCVLHIGKYDLRHRQNKGASNKPVFCRTCFLPFALFFLGSSNIGCHHGMSFDKILSFLDNFFFSTWIMLRFFSSGSRKASLNNEESHYCIRSVFKAPEFPPFHDMEANVYRYRRQIGVNLGGLFLLDRSLAPSSLLSCVINDEWKTELDFLESCTTLEKAKEALEDHWRTFVTERDFQFLSRIGVNSVRLPIGYWIVEPSGPFKKYAYVYKDAWSWVLHLIALASQYKIGVLIDLHGAPGNQNWLNCGTSTHKVQFFKPLNQELALNVLSTLAVALAPINNVIGLSLLNEPVMDPLLYAFYVSAYQTIRKATDILLPIYISDTYEKYEDMIGRHSMTCVVMDVHYPLNTERKLSMKRRRSSSLASMMKKSHDMTLSVPQAPIKNKIVGEWNILDDTSIDGQHHLRYYNKIHSAGHYFWNYRTSHDDTELSFVYCHRMRLVPEIVSAISSAKIEKIMQIMLPQQPQDIGYMDGYRMACLFLKKYHSRVGFKEQLAQTYAVNPAYEKSFYRALVDVDYLIDQHE